MIQTFKDSQGRFIFLVKCWNKAIPTILWTKEYKLKVFLKMFRNDKWSFVPGPRLSELILYSSLTTVFIVYHCDPHFHFYHSLVSGLKCSD